VQNRRLQSNRSPYVPTGWANTKPCSRIAGWRFEIESPAGDDLPESSPGT
jgi:hypothetical protein